MPVSTSYLSDSTAMRMRVEDVQRKNEEKNEKVILTKDEVIDILKTLEGIKRKLQPRVK